VKRTRQTAQWKEKSKAKSIVYKADVTTQSQQPTSTYIGLTANKFKDKCYDHKYSIQPKEDPTNDKYKRTKLSRHIWDLKDSGTDYTMKWFVLATAPAYNPAARKCYLCLKTLILKYECENLLNA